MGVGVSGEDGGGEVGWGSGSGGWEDTKKTLDISLKEVEFLLPQLQVFINWITLLGS